MLGLTQPMQMDGLLGGTPRDQGILAAALAGLSASGPSRMPVSMGQIMGQSGTAGMNAYGQAQQTEAQRAMMQMKIAEMQREQEERVKKQTAIAELAKDPRFQGMGPLLQLAPQAAIDRAFPKPVDPKVVAPGGSLVGVDGKPIYTAPNKPDKPAPSAIGKALEEMNALPPDSPLRKVYQDWISKQTTHAPAPSSNVTVKQETEFGKKVGGQLGEMYSDLLRAELGAPGSINKYTQLENLLGQVNTGKFRGTTQELKAAAKSIGFDLNALGVADDVAPAQAARALSSQLALELRNPAGGAGMPGAMSDKDREFLVSMVPSIENDPNAIKQMVEMRRKLAQRDQQVGRLAREYRRKNGRFDEGFFDELKTFAENNPLFTSRTQSPSDGLTPAGRAALKKYGGM